MQLWPDTDDLTVEEVAFRSGEYRLHGELAYRERGRPRGAVVLAGPHPLLGGNMHNNVVCGLGDGLARMGLVTLRFDYRGVGRSEGPPADVARHLAEFWQTAHAPDEMDFRHDVNAAAEFVRQAAPSVPLVLAGYSFGCAVLPSARLPEPIAAVVLIAPTVARHDYRPFQSMRCPLLVVASDDDFATDSEQLEAWLETLSMPRRLVRTHCDNHFFRGHEDWLVATVGEFLDGQWRHDA